MVCIWEGYHHLALVLNHFRVTDFMVGQSPLWHVHWLMRNELAAWRWVGRSAKQITLVLRDVHELFNLMMVLWQGHCHDSGSTAVMVIEGTSGVLVHLQWRQWTGPPSDVEDRLVDACLS